MYDRISKNTWEKMLRMWEYRKAYYIDSVSIVSDYEYDMLEKEVEKETEHIESGYEVSVMPHRSVGYSKGRHMTCVYIFNLIWGGKRKPLKESL